jgi:hypothetical protein
VPVGRADRDEDSVGRADRAGQIGREAQPAGRHVVIDHPLQSRFEDRNLATLQAFDFISVLVDTDHLSPELGKARAGHQSDIAGPDHGDLHGTLS